MAIGGATAHAEVVPTAAANHAVRVCGRTGRIDDSSRRICTIQVRTIFPYIAVHIMQPPLIRRIAADWLGLVDMLIEIGLSLLKGCTEMKGGGCSRTAGIFPLGLRREFVPITKGYVPFDIGGFPQLLTKGHRIVP